MYYSSQSAFQIDVTSNRKLLCRLLHLKGVCTESAIDGEDAVRNVLDLKGTFDLIFMDNTMPNMVRMSDTIFILSHV